MYAFQLNSIFGKPFQISKKEITKTILYKQIANQDAKNILKKINGFYGMIGPDINANKVDSIYQLFAGDGVIQGIFFEKEKITFIKKFIRTEKILFEEKHGKIPDNLLTTIIFAMGNKLKLLPNIIGRANTALLNINQNIYALFEGDNPYLLKLNFENKTIDTINKVNVPNIDYFCAHSKFNSDKQQIESLDYDVMAKKVNYYLLNSSFHTIQRTNVHTSYMPFIHDFAVSNNKILITESPFFFKFHSLKNIKLPIELEKNKPTTIHILDKNTNKYETYQVPESIFIFHYASFKENVKNYELLAPVYENIDFNDLNVEGRYRKIIIDKKTKIVTIEKNDKIDKFNLDFPLQFDNKVILLNRQNNRANGFVVCKDLTLIHAEMLKDKYICGEPVIVTIQKEPYLIAFENDSSGENSYLLIMNLKTYKKIEIELDVKLSMGFHSIFIENGI